MDSTTFKGELQELENSFPGQYTPRQIENCFLVVKHYAPKYFRDAINDLIRQKNRLPSIQDVIEAVKSKFEGDHDMRTKEGNYYAKKFWTGDERIAKTSAGKACLWLISTLSTATPEEFLENARKVSREHPECEMEGLIEQHQRLLNKAGAYELL